MAHDHITNFITIFKAMPDSDSPKASTSDCPGFNGSLAVGIEIRWEKMNQKGDIRSRAN